jgi:putative acetyltransferase
MSGALEQLSDEELLAAFESCTLSCEAWTHRAHIRVGYLYASQCDLPAAIQRMRAGLKALNAVHGTPESLERGYHETITVAFLRLIQAAARKETFPSSEDFCQRHPELLDKNLLLKFYSRERLRSLEAKTQFIAPDLSPLPPIAMTITIRPETVGDCSAIDAVNRRAFGQDEEANLVKTLREQGFVTLSLVAECDGQIVGHILFGPLVIATKSGVVAALSLAPMAVAPSWQRRGIGTKLIKEGLRRCKEAGHRIVIVVGHPEYYPRFGFSAALAGQLQSPFSGNPAWMALELVPGALRGIAGPVKYPPPFGIVR